MNNDPIVVCSIIDGVATICLNRPTKRNAINWEMRTALASAIAQIEGDANVRACVLTGAGENFCAGGDLIEINEAAKSVENSHFRMQNAGRVAISLLNLGKPVVAAVDGVAYGSGLALALACDVVIASSKARFCASFGRVGLIGDNALHFTLPRAVGIARAKELVFSGREIDAQEGRELGIAMRVVERGDLMAMADSMARSVSAISPVAISLSKDLFRRSFDMTAENIVEAESRAQAVCFQSRQYRNASESFRKRGN